MTSHSRLARCLSLSVVVLAGCGGAETPPAGTGAPTPPVRVPGPELGGVKQDLKDIRKDVTPPTVIGPGQPTAPAAQPGKSG